jgi:hypothetical protein
MPRQLLAMPNKTNSRKTVSCQSKIPSALSLSSQKTTKENTPGIIISQTKQKPQNSLPIPAFKH